MLRIVSKILLIKNRPMKSSYHRIIKTFFYSKDQFSIFSVNFQGIMIPEKQVIMRHSAIRTLTKDMGKISNEDISLHTYSFT